MGKHTLGPWACSSNTGNEADEKDWFVYEYKTGDAIAAGLLKGDARLIAAAPDLYDAIRNSDDAHWTPAMRAAIAKAEGVSLEPKP